MKSPRPFQIDADSLELLQTIERSEHESERFSAISTLASTGTSNAARILQDTFDRTVWRSTRFALIKALGHTKVERAVEFLCKIAANADDLGMAAEAILALGCTDSPVAGEFLSSIVACEHHPLTREALIAIANLNWFPCDDLIASVIVNADASTPLPVLQNAIIAAGLRSQTDLRGHIEGHIFGEGLPQSSPLFNTALIAIGRVGGAESLRKLEGLDTRFRAFANQIKTSAMENIRLRMGYAVEDAVAEIAKATDPASSRQAFQMLRAFLKSAAREAFELLISEASIDLQAKMRLFTCDQSTQESDTNFLVSHHEEMHASVFAALARVLYHANESVFLSRLSEAKTRHVLVKFLGCVRTAKSESLLFDLIENRDLDVDLRRHAINSLAVLPHMQVDAQEIVTRVGKRLATLVDSEPEVALKARMLRALGQIRYAGPEAITHFRQYIKEPGTLQSSAYAALALTDNDEAAKVVCKRLKQIVAQADLAKETQIAVETLSRFSSLIEAEPLANLLPGTITSLKVPLLKIMGLVDVPNLSSLIEEALSSGDFQQRLLAVAASKKHMSPQVAEKLTHLLDHKDPCISGRALDSLAVSGSAIDHERVLSWLDQRPGDAAAHMKVFRSISPRPHDNYALFLAHLDKMLASRNGAMNQQDIAQAATNLRDNLLSQVAPLSTSDGRKAGKMLTAEEQHGIDQVLRRELAGYGTYSETIKSVLRSGDLICQHPELFDATVDKSTVLIQYVKSIDLLLQERLGAAMFLQPGSDLLQKMQSRIVRLEMDDEAAFGPNLPADLQLSMYFSNSSFPAHKLSMICRSVMSGQLMREQYRVIDGLRAWALLLLLFGRSFKFRNGQMDPLLPMAKSSNDGIAKLARDMNDLQEARNLAAHRGTMLEVANIQEMRGICSKVLNSLHEHLIQSK